MYWRRQSIPELAGLNSNELKRYWRQRASAASRQPGYWIVSFVVTTSYLLLGWAIARCQLGPYLFATAVFCLAITFFLSVDQVTVHYARPHWRKMRSSGG